jgi:hypothetical protein
VERVRADVNRGHLFFVAEKTQAVIVRGVVNLGFMTSEGMTRLEDGMVVVTHPDDPGNVWAIRGEKFAQRYTMAKLRSGLIVPE